ncbi:hypothetical protein OG204_29860 [Streptomyces sp. NBC_01387]|uniref:TRAFAC clade GTPase domain-containing protein n=1 Tax=unclassified Streptomyces TaxID=2593676 RepID=UPI0020254748|nr:MULTISPECIES: hypothetical protein [unclassified Streptomyces]
MVILVKLALGCTAGVAVFLCLGYTFWMFLGLSLVTAGNMFGPRSAGTPDPRVRPVGTGEPAHRAYWSDQMWRDARDSVRGGLLSIRYRLTTEWLRRSVPRLFRGRRPTTGIRGVNKFTRTVLRAVAPGTAAGAILGALLATLVTTLVLLVFGVLLALVWLSAVTAVGLLRAVERLWRLVRHIRMKCPHPGCYLPFGLAVHRCPDCGAAHGELRPGRYGVLWHVCGCGRRLATTSLGGRGSFAARCPSCEQELPEAVGRTRVVHLPLIGGTSSGKTMLMAAMVAGLQAWSRRTRLTVEYASPSDRKEATALKRQVDSAGWALKTQGGPPRALMLYVGHGRQRRLLYLYDPMGESLRDAGVVREQQYLAHADGVVLVADVLAEPQVRRALHGDDANLAAGARPADQGPMDTYQRLTGELSALTGRRGRLPVATVVTKRDVLDGIAALPVPGTRIDGWLEGIGLGALVRAVRHDFGTARYWAVSARAATGAGALDREQRRAAEPVLWVLALSGLRVGSLVAEDHSAGLPGPRAGTATGTGTGTAAETDQVKG